MWVDQSSGSPTADARRPANGTAPGANAQEAFAGGTGPPQPFRLRSSLDLFGDMLWASYCPVNRAGHYVGQEITVCGLVVGQRIHHQGTGEPMKFLTIADKTDISSTDLFADTYRSYGLATVRYPILEVTAKVEAFENGRGWTLRVLRAVKPRTVSGNAEASGSPTP